MVEYLISSRVNFRPEDGAMWPVKDENSVIILTITMNRLLAYLLERRGQVVTRDELLANVWDSHGLRSSNHTLNKYISEIRKHLVNAGIQEECITTVPRVGFMFNSDIEVIPDGHPENELFSDANNTQVEKNIIAPVPPVRYRGIYNALALTAIIASAALIFLAYQLPTRKIELMKDTKTYFLFNYQTCPVYTIQKNSDSLLEEKKKFFLNLVDDRNISCLDGSSFLYQVSESYLYGSKGRAFISRCTSKNNQYISCLNNYWSGYESSK